MRKFTKFVQNSKFNIRESSSAKSTNAKLTSVATTSAQSSTDQKLEASTFSDQLRNTSPSSSIKERTKDGPTAERKVKLEENPSPLDGKDTQKSPVPEIDPAPLKESKESDHPSFTSTPRLAPSDHTATRPAVCSEHLWDEAYDALQQEVPDLVSRYEAILSSIMTAPSTDSQKGLDAYTDPEKWQQLRYLLDIWLASQNDSETGRLRKLLRDHIRHSTETTLSGASAWICLCFASSILLDPQSETEKICLGLIRIISKMDWYICLSRLLNSRDTSSSSDGEESLRQRIVELYTAILSFGVNASLLSLRYSQATTCEAILTRLEAAEDDLSLFSGMSIKQQLDDIIFTRKKKPREISAVGNYSTKLSERITEQLKSLGYVDPRMGLLGSEIRKVHSVQEFLPWIYSTDEYKNVIDWDHGTGRALLITGAAGIGKTALMDAIVRHLLDDALSKVESNGVDSDHGQETSKTDNRSSNPTSIDGEGSSNTDPDDSDSSDSSSGDAASTSSDKEIRVNSKEIPWALSYYFCGRTGLGLDNSTKVLRSLIYSLLEQQPRLIAHLDASKRSTGRDRFDNPNDFTALSGIFFRMLKDEHFIHSYLVVDGIELSSPDEKYEYNDLLQLIQNTANLQSKVRWLVSANTDLRIEWELRKLDGLKHLIIREGSLGVPAGAFDRVIENTISKLFTQKRYEENSKSEIERLISEKSKRNVTWVATACAILQKEDSWYAIDVLREMPQNLEELYGYARESIARLPRQDSTYCEDVLSIMAIAFRPLSVQELTTLVGLPPLVDIQTIIGKCRPFLETQGLIVQFIDPSARHYAQKHFSQSSKPASRQPHSLLTTNALGLLSAHFEYGQDGQRTLTDRYETVHWLRHLLKIDDITNDSDITGSVNFFIENYLLLWLEVIIQDNLQMDVRTLILDFENFLLAKSSEQSTPLRLVREARKILDSCMTESSIFHTNPNSVIFYPDNSALKQKWKTKHGNWLVKMPAFAKGWDDDSLILASHSDWVRSIAFCPNGRLLASGSDDTTVRIWDVQTGLIQLNLEEHNDWVRCVAFSPSGHLATGSDNNVIYLWDLSTGECCKKLPDQAGSVMAICFSPDGHKLVVGTSSGPSLWNISDLDNPVEEELENVEKLVKPFVVFSVDFSQKGRWIASTGVDNDVQIWNGSDNTLKGSLQGHHGSVLSVSFSPSEQYIASGFRDGTVLIWDVESGTIVYTLNLEAPVLSVAFSPDNSFVAAGSKDTTVTICNISAETERPKLVMKGHRQQVRTVAFGQRGILASGSDDSTIRFWRSDDVTNKEAGLEDELAERGNISFLTVSPDGLSLASVSGYFIHLWDTKTGQPKECHILYDHNGLVQSIRFSPEGKRLVSTSNDMTVRLWDVAKGTSLHVFNDHTDWVRFAVFSPDGRYIASASDDTTVRIWSCEEDKSDNSPITLEGHEEYVRTVAFSPDGKLLASGGDDLEILIWDFESLHLQCKLQLSHRTTGIIFSLDSSQIVSRSADYDLRVWDLRTQNCIQGPISTERVSRQALFDARYPEYMLTEFGADPLHIEPSSFFSPPSLNGNRYGISALGDSITWNGRDVIPIPEKYRPTASWVQGNIVAFGTASGEVLLFQFSEDVKPPLWPRAR